MLDTENPSLRGLSIYGELPIITRRRNQPSCPSTEEWMEWISFNHKEEQSYVVYRKVDAARDQIKQIKPGSGRHVLARFLKIPI